MEIEHKYRVASDEWQHLVAGQKPVAITQYYMPDTDPDGGGYGQFFYTMLEDCHAIGFDNANQYRIPMLLDAKAVRTYEKLGTDGHRAIFGDRGTIAVTPQCEIRVRIEDGVRAFLTIKAKSTERDARYELETPIAMEDARFLIQYAPPPLHKLRYTIPMQHPLKWEVDVYQGDNAGLVTAEIELPKRDTPYLKPNWLGENITADSRYSNRALAGRPYGQWGEHEKRLQRGTDTMAAGL